MNLFRRTRFVLAVALLAAVPAAALADVCTCPPERHHPVTLSFFPPISTNGCLGPEVKSNFALNIIGGHLGALEGLELGGLFNFERYHVTGVQVAGGYNRAGGDLTGLQLGALNCVRGDAYGLQLGAFNRAVGDQRFAQVGAGNLGHGSAITQLGGFNFAGDWTAFTLGGVNWACGRSGLQLGAWNWARAGVGAAQVGGFNITGGCVPFQLGALNGAGGNSALQLGGFNLGGADNCVELGGVNILRGVSGFQLGAVNLAGGMYDCDNPLGLVRSYYPKLGGVQLGGINAAGGSFGAQVGAVNIASEARWFQFGAFNFARESEVPIGPLNVILNGQFRVAAFASEAGLGHFELKTGGRHFYNVLSVGYLPTDSARVLLGYGVGGHFPCCGERLFVDADLVGFRVNPMDDLMSFDGTSYLAKLRVTGGWAVAPPLSLIGGLAVNGWLSDSETGADIPFLPIPMLTLEGDTNISIWPGFLFGVEVRAW